MGVIYLRPSGENFLFRRALKILGQRSSQLEKSLKNSKSRFDSPVTNTMKSVRK